MFDYCRVEIISHDKMTQMSWGRRVYKWSNPILIMRDGYKFPGLKRKILKDYIRKNPECTSIDIKKNTSIKVERLYKSMKEAYKDAGVKLSKNLTKRDRKEQIKEVITYIGKNPGCTVNEITEATRVTIPRVFKSILKAYEMAGVKYPKREVTEGIKNPYVIKRCKKFEKRIIDILGVWGKTKSQVRISNKIIDCLFEYGGENFVVEIKDYRVRNITMSDVKQLIKYMNLVNYKKGLIICPKESFPKKKNSRNVYIDNLMIKILSEEDLRGRSTNHFESKLKWV